MFPSAKRLEVISSNVGCSDIYFLLAFTRMRYCFPNGQLEMYSKESPEHAPPPLKPWFAIPGPVSEEYSIAFGHWASLDGRGTPEGIYALDTGCCWGGDLTCLRWEDKTWFVQPSNRQQETDDGDLLLNSGI